MIIKNICLLLEALSIIICLHNLYNEKIKLEIITVVFLSFDMIVMTAINFYGFSQTYMTTLAIYPIIALTGVNTVRIMRKTSILQERSSRRKKYGAK